MKVGWLSDIHLDFLSATAAREFVAGLASHNVEAWVLSGDIGQADSVMVYLLLFEELVPCTTYFTLGNHDFYGGSLARVREEMSAFLSTVRRLVWLTSAQPATLNGVAIVGDDAWGDARFGDPRGSTVQLSDFYLIKELTGLSRPALIRKVNRLGDEAAARLAPKLECAAGMRDRVLVVTHVPPFREAAWYDGGPSDDEWVPWFSCRAVGEAILQCAQAHPDVRFLVLCGHTHGSGSYSPVDNVVVRTADAQYRAPRVQELLDVSSRAGFAWPN